MLARRCRRAPRARRAPCCVGVAADVQRRAALEPLEQLARRLRAMRAARRACAAPSRENARSRRVSKPCLSGLAATRAGRGNRWRNAAHRRRASCGRCAPLRARSWRKPRNGATPVPGPIMITSRDRRRAGGSARWARRKTRTLAPSPAGRRGNAEAAPGRPAPSPPESIAATVRCTSSPTSRALEAIEYRRGASGRSAATSAPASQAAG